jgi:hypothetical protein
MWVVGLVIAAGGVVAGFLILVYRIISGLRGEMAERDSAAQLEKERAKLVEDELRRDLSDYKVHAAEKFATKDGVSQAVTRMEGSIQNLANQVEGAVDRLTGRIDKLLDGPAPASRRRTGT